MGSEYGFHENEHKGIAYSNLLTRKQLCLLHDYRVLAIVRVTIQSQDSRPSHDDQYQHPFC
jgi:hypothetical protein